MDPLKDVEKITYAKSAATGLAFLHHCGIIQGDVGCHNMLLDSKGVLKLADFAGSSVDGSPASVDYEKGSRLPGQLEPTQKTDIFALGSAFFEMETRTPPYQEKSLSEIDKLYKQGRFTDWNLAPLLGKIIKKCWHQRYQSALEIIEDLDRLPAQYQKTARVEETLPIRIIQPQKEARLATPKHEVLETYVPSTKNMERAYRYDVDCDQNVEMHRARDSRSWKKKPEKPTFAEWIQIHFLPSGRKRRSSTRYATHHH
jgi:serine/threonine protein kinase